MLLPDNIHPENSVYYNGAFVLQTLLKESKQELISLFENVRKIKEMSFSLFVLCLDWLYLIGVAVLNNNGEVELCS